MIGRKKTRLKNVMKAKKLKTTEQKGEPKKR